MKMNYVNWHIARIMKVNSYKAKREQKKNEIKKKRKETDAGWLCRNSNILDTV